MPPRDMTYAQWILIHAPPCGERQLDAALCCPSASYFNPRSPCGERRCRCLLDIKLLSLFQSTLPMWGATRRLVPHANRHIISIHAPMWGATSLPASTSTPPKYFNPRSPCGERPALFSACVSPGYFNPRSPCGERLPPIVAACTLRTISIHAPHVGSDHAYNQTRPYKHDFNPRSPCGERRSCVTAQEYSQDFNPRSPCGERPVNPIRTYATLMISIHAPHVGSDFAQGI